MKHIFEHAGVMLDVDYTPGDDGIPTFNSVRVLGDDYKPTGPDLTAMLHSVLVLTEPFPNPAAESFLSAICAEL